MATAGKFFFTPGMVRSLKNLKFNNQHMTQAQNPKITKILVIDGKSAVNLVNTYPDAE